MKKIFRHAHQLAQLKTLDPTAHRAASVALRGGFVAIAARIVVKAMQAALTRLATPPPAPLLPCPLSPPFPCPPALPSPAAFDLIIATRKVAKFAGHVQSSDGKITWWKQAGQEKVSPKGTLRLTDTVIAMKLKKYELVKQEATGTEIWHCFKLKDLGAAPGDGGVSEADLSGPLPAEYRRMLAMREAL